MSVRELVSKHSFAPAEAKGKSDNAFGTQRDAIAYADDEIKIRVTSSYYGFLYVEPGGQCGGYIPCKFHVFINSKDNVVAFTKKKWTSWQKELIKEAGKTVPFQITPVDASGQPKVARRRRRRREVSASEEEVSASEEEVSDSEEEDSASDAEDSASDVDSEEIEKLNRKNRKLDKQKKKYKKKFDKQKKELTKKFEKKLKQELDNQKKSLKESVLNFTNDLKGKLKKCKAEKSGQSDLALENEKLREKIRKLLTVFKTLKEKVDTSVKRM